MIIKFESNQMNAMLWEDDDFALYFLNTIMPKHLPQFSDMIRKPETLEMIKWGRRYAEHFRFSDPIYQIHFVVLMWRIGPDFFEFEPYHAIVNNLYLSEEERVERCNLEPTFEQEDYAIRNSKSGYWFPQYTKGNLLGVPYDSVEEEILTDIERTKR